MAQNNGFDISRREILAGLGTIGVASAGAGLGTTAYFSDREDFANNQLTAGELDLKVDWQEHYSDWSDDEAAGIETVAMEPADGLAGFPSSAPLAEQSVFVSDPQQFLENTAIEAYPDVTNADTQDYDGLKDQLANDSDICELDADTDEGRGGVLSSSLRTRGTFPLESDLDLDDVNDLGNRQTTEEGDPLVQIADVKPGDFGEVTFSFHLCGNPGYVWLTGDLIDASENGYTEPEIKDDDESGEPGDDPANDTDIELLDEIRVAFWYDTGADGAYGADFEDKDAGEGDNYLNDGEVMIPLLGSLRFVLTVLSNQRFPLDFAPIQPAPTGGMDNETDEYPMVSGLIDSNNQYIQEIVVTGEDPRFENGPGGGTARNYQCPDYRDNLGVTDIVGSEVINPDVRPIEEGMMYRCCTTLTVDDYPDGEVVNEENETGDITLSSSGPVKIVSIKGGPRGEQVYVFNEPVVLNGATFTTPGDHGISNIDICCPVDDNGNGGVPPAGEPGRQCFPNSTTAYVGFEWWLPVNHANEIQTDSVSFDLGFYTEQCRHNDGSGQPSDG